MVDPSSSHTAGALRCAQVAASLPEGHITQVHFTLWNSFSQTYRGHGTDRALVAGILGLSTDDEHIRDAFNLAHQQHLDFDFVCAGENSTLHPNTVDIEMHNESGMTATVRGESLGGRKIRISRINSVSVNISGAFCTLFVAHRDALGALAALTNLLAEAQVNIAFCSTYRTEAGGQTNSVFETDEHYSGDSFLSAVRKLHLVDYATFVEVPGTNSTPLTPVSQTELFDSVAQLLDACHELNVTIGGVMRKRESHFASTQAIRRSIECVLAIMKDETSMPLTHPQPSLGSFIGGEAQTIADATPRFSDALLGSVQSRATAYAMAVLERSASMGVIVAALTAGSAGVVPGCILALGEHLHMNNSELEEHFSVLPPSD